MKKQTNKRINERMDGWMDEYGCTKGSSPLTSSLAPVVSQGIDGAINQNVLDRLI